MHRRFPLILTLTAWLFATGSQWDIVQTFAWARMFSKNIQTRSLGAALARTFSVEGRCELCGAVTRAKQQQDNDAPAPGGKPEGKPLLIFQPIPVVVVAAPEFAPWLLEQHRPLSADRAAPPLPPPRARA